jgi:hypothetical protein
LDSKKKPKAEALDSKKKPKAEALDSKKKPKAEALDSNSYVGMRNLKFKIGTGGK